MLVIEKTKINPIVDREGAECGGSDSVGCSEGKITGAIKSDGGSSTYYDIAIPTRLLTEIIERRNEDGLSYIKTEEIIELGLGNDFDFGNIFKCMIRMQSLKNGKGKAGNNLEYDAKKVEYTAKKMARRYSTK